MLRTALFATTALMLVSPVRAATIQTSLAAFQAVVGASAINTTSILGNNFDPISSVQLVNGTTIALSGAFDVVDQPGFGDLPFTNGYTGQVVDSTTNTETLTFSTPRTRFGVTVAPDVPFIGPASTSVTFTVTLGDGTSTTLTNSYVGGGTQFFGFTGSSRDQPDHHQLHPRFCLRPVPDRPRARQRPPARHRAHPAAPPPAIVHLLGQERGTNLSVTFRCDIPSIAAWNAADEPICTRRRPHPL